MRRPQWRVFVQCATCCSVAVGLSSCFLDRSALGGCTAGSCASGEVCVAGACISPADAGLRDGGRHTSHDGGLDAGAADSGPLDGGGADAGPGDAAPGPADSGPPDSGPTCAGETVARAATAGPSAAGEAACTPEGVLARGGVSSGLGRVGRSPPISLDGQDVVSCVAADFGQLSASESAVVSIRAVGMVCGASCTTHCNTGRVAYLFSSVDGATYTSLGSVTVTSTFEDYMVPTPTPVRSILVCRGGFDASRDHLEVDYISLLCP